ncbi:MAG: hypothetical protein JWP92_1396, partial [Caulobacter sp.]|nr:hypothetical protein [Caulobacter sp.]
MPKGWQASNLKPLAYIRVDPTSTRAFKMSMKRVGDLWYLFVANGGRDGGGFEVFDVTDPQKPIRVTAVEVPGGNGQLTLGGDLLIVAQQAAFAPNSVQEQPYAGVPHRMRSLATLFDVSDPRHPKQLSTWNTDGWGTHRNVYPGGRYAYMSAWVAGFKGQATLVVLDVSDPRKPVEVSHWWQPGQRDGEPDRPSPNGYHGPATVSADGKMLTAAYTPALVNLDISDPTHPSLIGKLEFSPLANVGAQALHSGVPLPGGMVHVSTEPSKPGCDKETLSFAAIVDNRDPAAPRLVAHYPRPQPPKGAPYRSFCDKGGRVGPHNINGEIHSPDLQRPGPLVYMTYFTAGVRVYDLANPYDPKEIGWFLPAMGDWASGDRGLEDVIVDTRGNAFVSDGRQKGVWVLRFTAQRPSP